MTAFARRQFDPVIVPEASALWDLLHAAAHALRSYEHGNTAPALAKTVADAIDHACYREQQAPQMLADLCTALRQARSTLVLEGYEPTSYEVVLIDAALKKATSR